MLTKGPAKRVTIFINEDAPHGQMALHDSIMMLLLRKGVAGATATRGLSGFGAHHALHSPQVEARAEHLPIRIEFVESPERTADLLPLLYDMVTDGLIEVQDTTVVKHARKQPAAEPKLPHQRRQGPAKLLRVFIGEADRFHGEPLYEAIVQKLRMSDIAGATVYRGILGYGAKGHQHKKSFFHVSHDMPVVVTAIDDAAKIAAAAQTIEGMIEDGLIVISDVEIVRLVRGRPALEAADVPDPAR